MRATYAIDKLATGGFAKYVPVIGYSWTLYEMYTELEKYIDNKKRKNILDKAEKNATGIIYYEVNVEAAGRVFHYKGVYEGWEYPYVD